MAVSELKVSLLSSIEVMFVLVIRWLFITVNYIFNSLLIYSIARKLKFLYFIMYFKSSNTQQSCTSNICK